MADKSRKPIEDIEVGEQVLATDPETGETVAREVTHLWVHQDTLVDLVVDGDVITTTEDHPFWNKTDQEWQRVDEFDEGDLVRSADGDLLAVQGPDRSGARTATAYNRTRLNWTRMKPLTTRWLPRARVLHPLPRSTLRRSHPRQEPSALAAHAGICTGGRPQWQSLPMGCWVGTQPGARDRWGRAR